RQLLLRFRLSTRLRLLRLHLLFSLRLHLLAEKRHQKMLKLTPLYNRLMLHVSNLQAMTITRSLLHSTRTDNLQVPQLTFISLARTFQPCLSMRKVSTSKEDLFPETSLLLSTSGTLQKRAMDTRKIGMIHIPTNRIRMAHNTLTLFKVLMT